MDIPAPNYLLVVMVLITYLAFTFTSIALEWRKRRLLGKEARRVAYKANEAISVLEKFNGEDGIEIRTQKLLRFDALANELRSYLFYRMDDIRAFVHQLWGAKEALASEVTRAQENFENGDLVEQFTKNYQNVVFSLEKGKINSSYTDLGSVFSVTLSGRDPTKFDNEAEKETAMLFFQYSDAILRYGGRRLSEEIEARFKSRAKETIDFWLKLSPLTTLAWDWVRHQIYPMRVGWRINPKRSWISRSVMATSEEVIGFYVGQLAVAVAEKNRPMLIRAIREGFNVQGKNIPYVWIKFIKFFLRMRMNIAGVKP